MVEHTITVQVRWSDADPAGIVFYPRFYEWYDLGAAALFEAIGLPWPEMFPKYGLVGLPIVESGSRFTAPVRWGDRVSLHSRIAWVKEKAFRVDHEVSANGVLCARGFEVRVWAARPRSPEERVAARPIPEEIARRLRENPRRGASPPFRNRQSEGASRPPPNHPTGRVAPAKPALESGEQ